MCSFRAHPVSAGARGQRQSEHADEGQSNRAHKGQVRAHIELADHEGVHRAAGHIAAKAEGAWLAGNECDCSCLARVGLYGDSIVIDVQAMDHIRADELDRDRIAGIDFKLR